MPPPERRERVRLDDEREDLEDFDDLDDRPERSRGSARRSLSRPRLPEPSKEGSILFPDRDLPAMPLKYP